MANFRDRARKATSLSELMSGKTRITTDEMIQQFPQGFTISDFDIIRDSQKEYPVFVIKENTDICFFGGLVLMNMVNDWLEGYESVEKCREDFRSEGGVPIKMTTGKTKNGNNITRVEVL